MLTKGYISVKKRKLFSFDYPERQFFCPNTCRHVFCICRCCVYELRPCCHLLKSSASYHDKTIMFSSKIFKLSLTYWVYFLYKSQNKNHYKRIAIPAERLLRLVSVTKTRVSAGYVRWWTHRFSGIKTCAESAFYTL